MTPPIVDVVIPVYRPGAWLPVCVESVLGSRDVDVRVVVVDDTPADPLVSSYMTTTDRVRLLALDRNIGFAAAANRGIAAGAAPYVLLLNQDARIAPDYLARVCGHLDGDASLAAVGGKILHQPGPSATPDGTIDSAGIAFRRGRRAVDIGQGDPDDGRYDGWRDVFGVCAAVATYRRSALDAVTRDGEVMDESFFMHKEDVDLAWRLRRAGYRAAVDGAAVAYHERGTQRAADRSTTRRRGVAGVAAMFRAEHAKARWVRRLAWRNQLRMLVNNETAYDLARSFHWILLHQLAYLAIGLVLDPFGTFVARARFMTEFPSLLAKRRRPGRNQVNLTQWLP